MNFCQHIYERLLDLIKHSGRRRPGASSVFTLQDECPDTANPWQRNLERLAEQHGQALPQAREINAVEQQFNQLIEQAQLEKTKEVLRQQKEILQNGGKKARPTRQNDATVTDARAWWGQSVATWDPEDGKNVTNYEQKKPNTRSKWFDV